MASRHLRSAVGRAGIARHHHALRAVSGVWRGVLAVVIVLTVGFLLVGAAVPLGSAIDVLLGGEPVETAAVAFTPGLWLAGNVLLALLIPVSMLTQWACFGVRPRWLLSVTGVFRWRWLARLVAVLAPLWLVYSVLLAVLRPSGRFLVSTEVLALVAVAVVTVSLQSAGEEFAFRGLVQRAVGSWFTRSSTAFVVSTVVSGAVFAGIHVPPDGWALAHYLVAAAALSVMVRSTGGLEASVLVHSMSNLLVLLPLLLAGDVTALGNRVTGPVHLLPIVAMVLTALLVHRQAHRRALAVVTSAPPLP